MNPNAISPVNRQPELSAPSAQLLSPSTDNTSGAGAGSTWSGFRARIAFPIARLIPQQVKDSFSLARDFTYQGVNTILNTRAASTLVSLKKLLPGQPDLKQHLDFYKNTGNTPVKRSSDSEDGSPVKRARYEDTTIAINSEATTSEQATQTGEDNPHSNSEGMLQPETAMDSETDTLHLPEEIAPQTEEITLNSLEQSLENKTDNTASGSTSITTNQDQSLENETATIESALPFTTASLNSEPRAEEGHQPDLLEIPVQTALQTENETATTETGLPSTVVSPDSEPMTKEDHQPGLLEMPVKTGAKD